MANFTDITIVNLYESRTHNPNPSKLLYNVSFKLLASPPAVWREIIEAERKFPGHNRIRPTHPACVLLANPIPRLTEYVHFPRLRIAHQLCDRF